MPEPGNREEGAVSADNDGGKKQTRSRRSVVLSALATGAVAGCITGGSNPTPNPTLTPTASPEATATPQATETSERTQTPLQTPEASLELEPPFPETDQEIAQYREQRLAEHYEKHGNPQKDEPTRISSIQELAEYAREDDVHVKMEPGTYEITPDNYADIIDTMVGPRGARRATLLHFSGRNSYWDLRDVKIKTETLVIGQFNEALSKSTDTIDEVMLTARDSILRGLDYENVHNEDWSVGQSTAGSNRSFNIWGARNLIQDVSITSRTSYPYGYSSLLGKGAGSVVNIRKKGCIAGGGLKNTHVGMEAHARSFGHALGFLDFRDLEFIDCIVEGEIRSTNDILAETSGPMYENDFKMQDREYDIPSGVMISYQEDAFRSYGDLAVGKILGCTVNGTRTGTALTGGEVYIAGLTTKNTPRRGITGGSNFTIRNSSADFKYSPGLLIGSWNKHIQNVDAEVTLLPSQTDESITKQFYSYSKLPAANPWPFVAAGIAGEGHDVVLKPGAEDLGKPEAPVVVGTNKFAEDSAQNVTLVNRTNQPVILRSDAENCTVESRSPVDDRGSNNDVQRL
jgi:hypothetical protein